MWLEIFGYVASAVVAASFLMSKVTHLRWSSVIGAFAFAVYGVLTNTWPIVGVNSFIVLVNLVFLWRLRRQKDLFETLTINSPQSAFLRHFLEFYGEDVARWFPDFDLDRMDEPHISLTLRNMVPVGLFVHTHEGDGRAVIQMDYVTPAYRDLRTAYYLLREKGAELRAEGVHELIARSWHPKHDAYLRKMGFELLRDDGESRTFKRKLEDNPGTVSAPASLVTNLG